MKTSDSKTTAQQHRTAKGRQPLFKREGRGVFGQKSFFNTSKSSTGNPLLTGVTTSPVNVQARLTVGKPDDKYEKEADATAGQVVRDLDNNREGQTAKEEVENQEKHQARKAPLAANMDQGGEQEEASPLNTVQAKCETCGQDLPVTASTTGEEPNGPSGVQRKCDKCTGSAEEKAVEKVNLQAESPEQLQRKAIFESAEPAIQRSLTDTIAKEYSEDKQEEQKETDVVQRRSIFETGAEQEESKGDSEEVEGSAIQRQNLQVDIMPQSDGGEDETSPAFETKLESSKGGGKPLPKDTQHSMESAFDADFSQVKVHTGKEAQEMSKSIHAQAFTHGRDIYFNEGKYQPKTSQGKELLAHELTHTIQQGAAIKKKPSIQKAEEEEYDGAKEIRESEREAELATDPLLAQQAEARAEQEGEAAQQQAEATAPQVEAAPAPPPKESPNKEVRVAKPKNKAPDKMNTEPKEDAEPLGEVGQTMEQESANVCDDGAADAQQLANNQQAHDSAAEKQQQSEASVESPEAEGQSRANAEQVANLDQTEEPQIAPADNARALDETIEDNAPRDIEELNEFKPKEQAKVMGNEVLAETSKQVGEVQGTYNEIENEVPAHENPTNEPLPPIETAPNTPTLNMGKGAVPEVKEEQVDISEYESNADAEFEKEVPNKDLQAEIGKVTDGEIGQANQERANISEKVVSEPASIMEFATERQQNVEDEMLQEEEQAKSSMEQKREQDLAAANEQQNAVKSAREQKKAEIIARIEEIHKTAKIKIDEKLSALEQDSLRRFDEGQERYAAIFERDANADKRAWQKERYSGIWGAVTWVGDQFRKVGEFPEVKAFFDRRRNEFINNINLLISEINRDNEQTINDCKQILADSSVEIEDMIAEELPHAEGLAAEMREYGANKLAELDNHIEEQKEKLQEALCDKKKQAIEDIDKKIEQMKEDMNGMFANLLSLLADLAIKFFEWALEKLGINPQEIMDVINKGKAVLMTIVGDPIQFFKNLAMSVKTGLDKFVDNIWTHLMNGMITWLTGSMGDIQIKLPQKWDFMGILDLVLQILGLTWPNIRAILVEKLGEPVVRAAEEVVNIVQILREEGLVGVWNYIKDFIMSKVEELKNKVFDMIIEFITIEVVKKAVTELLLMLNPVGAIMKAIMSIYRLVMFLVNNLQKIMAFVKSVIDTIEPIANGAIEKAATNVENALARTVPIVLAFIARMIGLGGIGKDIQRIIQKVRGFVLGLVEKGVDWIINFAKDIFNSLLGKGGDDGDEDDEEDDEGDGDEEELGDTEVGEKMTFSADGESHRLWIADQGSMEVMVASSSENLESKVRTWIDTLNKIEDADKQNEARGLLSQVSNQLSITLTEAEQAKLAIDQAEENMTNAAVENAKEQDDEAEDAERKLIMPLTRLFELFGEESLVVTYKSELAKTDSSAEQSIIEELVNDGSKYSESGSWSGVKNELVQNAREVKDMHDKPLGTQAADHEFGKSNFSSLFLPGLGQAMSDEGKKEEDLKTSKEQYAKNRKGVIHGAQSTPEGEEDSLSASQKVLRSLQEQIFDGPKRGSTLQAVVEYFKKSLKGFSTHNLYKPQDIDQKIQNGALLVTYHYGEDAKLKGGRKDFTIVFKLDEVDGKTGTQTVLGENLALKVPGTRGYTASSGSYGSKVDTGGVDIHSAHLIADQFMGSGYKAGLNLILTSDKFNTETMATAEATIKNRIRDIQIAHKEKLVTFSLIVTSRWEVLPDAPIVKLLSDLLSTSTEDLTEEEKDELAEKTRIELTSKQDPRKVLGVKYKALVSGDDEYLGSAEAETAHGDIWLDPTSTK